MKKTLLVLLALTLSLSAYADDFNIATGSEGGGYEQQGRIALLQINKQFNKIGYKADFEVLNTNGTGENIELLNSEEAQLAIVQADGLNVNAPSVPYIAKKSKRETVFWVYNKEHGYDDLSDVEGEDVLIALVDGSGADYTMQSFVREDSGYKKLYDTAVLTDDTYDAFDLVAEGKAKGKKLVGMLYVGTKIPAEFIGDFKGKILVGSATDSDFNDAEDVNGDPLYEDCEVNKGMLSGLTDAWGSLDTVCVYSMIVYSTDVDDRKVAKAIKKGVNKAIRGML